jgi:hypothetical protein
MAKQQEERVRWRPGLTLPRQWTETFDASERLPYRVELELEGDRDGPQCRAIRLVARPGETITASGLREVPLGQLIRLSAIEALGADMQAAADAVMASRFGGSMSESGDVIEPADHASDEHLQRVAEVYLAARKKPTQAVHDNWPFVSYSTAARWVGLARRRGFIPPPEPMF